MKPVEPGSPQIPPARKGELEITKVAAGSSEQLPSATPAVESAIHYMKSVKESDPLERSYEQVVKDMRQASAEALLKADCDVVKVQEEISRSFGLLMAQLAKKAEEKIGPPPTPYAIVGLGSLSRNEASPYSDLDFAILIGDDTSENRTYFQKLNTEMHLLVEELKETHKDTRGIAYCVGGLNPPYLAKRQTLGSVALLDTPKQLALWCGEEIPDHFDRRKNQASSLALSVATLQISRLCGDESLVEECQMEQRAILTQQVREQKALKMMANKESLRLEAPGAAFDLKRKIVRPIQEVVGFLCLFYGIEEQNTLKAIDQLMAKELMGPEIGLAIKNIFALAYKIRAKAHLHFKKEIDALDLKETRIENVIDEDEVVQITECIQIIDDIKSRMKIFENSSGKKNPFSSKI